MILYYIFYKPILPSMVSSAVAFSSSRLVLAMHVYIPWSLRFTFMICSIPSSTTYLNIQAHLLVYSWHANQTSRKYSAIYIIIDFNNRKSFFFFLNPHQDLHQIVMDYHCLYVPDLFFIQVRAIVCPIFQLSNNCY